MVVGGKHKPGAQNPSSRSPAAASVATDKEGKQFCNPFEWLATYKPTYVATRWHRSLRGDFYCAICNGKEKHHPTKCPLLSKLGLKLITVGGGGRGGKPGSSSGSPPLAGTSDGPKPGALVPPAAAQTAVVSPPALALGSPSAPAGLTATVEEGNAGNKSSTESFQWEGDENGVDFKPKGPVSFYPPSPNLHSSDRPLRLSTPSRIPSEPSCSQVSLASVAPTASYGGSFHNFSPSDADPLPIDIVLPPGLVLALLTAISPDDSTAGLRLVMADTGATDHMVPDRSAFISYKAVCNLCVQMGNNSYAPVLGQGTAIISFNGQRLLIRNVLHIPVLRVPLYSLRAHIRHWGCGFVGSYDTGMHVYFPGVVLSVDTSTNCHLSYKPVGKLAPLSTLHYVQPRCPPTIYQDEGSAFWIKTDSSDPVFIEDDCAMVVGMNPPAPVVIEPTPTLPLFHSIVPKCGPLPKVPPFSADDIATITQHLKLLLDRLSGIAASSSLDSSPQHSRPVAPKLLSSLSSDKVVRLVHHPGSSPPPVCPCDRSNSSDTKTHWTLEELHRALGCRCFCNYKHILQTSLDGENGGGVPLSLGTYTTIPKAPHGSTIDREQSFFLDIVHVDIAFGDCVLVGGFQYSLIFVNRATRYNWVFGLKDLSKESILSAFHLFWADAGSYAWCFRCDCDPKLFGTTIWEHLIDNNSNIIAVAAGCQSSNGLVESHWKIMVHMARAYLTEKQMPRSFWFYAVVHSARMMNAIPGKLGGKLASPFLLAHSVGHDDWTWFPLFLVCYFHHERDGNVP